MSFLVVSNFLYVFYLSVAKFVLNPLNVKEWKVHLLSEWKQFHSKRVKFHSYRVNFDSEKSEILLCHSLKSDISLFKEWKFHSFRVNFSLFLRIDPSSHSFASEQI